MDAPVALRQHRFNREAAFRGDPVDDRHGWTARDGRCGRGLVLRVGEHQ